MCSRYYITLSFIDNTKENFYFSYFATLKYLITKKTYAHIFDT